MQTTTEKTANRNH